MDTDTDTDTDMVGRVGRVATSLDHICKLDLLFVVDWLVVGIDSAGRRVEGPWVARWIQLRLGLL